MCNEFYNLNICSAGILKWPSRWHQRNLDYDYIDVKEGRCGRDVMQLYKLVFLFVIIILFFQQIVNLKHVMPTRYTATDIVFDKVKINKEILKDPARRKKARRMVKAKLEERYV